MQASTPRPGLPSIRVMLVLAAAVYVLPLGWMAQAEYREADQRVHAAEAAQATATRLGAMLRVAPALTIERNATGALLAVGRSSDLPDPLRAAIGIDFDAEVERARAAVDRATAEVADPAFVDALGRVRSAATDPRAAVEDVDALYADLAARLGAEIDRDLAGLSSHAIQAGGGPELTDAARVAEAAAAVQIEQVGQSTLWVVVTASFDRLTVADVAALADSLARLEQAMFEFEAEVEPQSEAGRLWNDPDRRAVAAEHLRAYADDVAEKMAGGLPLVAPPPSAVALEDLTLDDAALAGIATFVDEVVARLEVDVQVTEGIAQVVDASLADVDERSAALAAGATEAKNTVVVWIAAVALASMAGGLLLASMLARPVTQLARAAEAMSAGDLDQRIPVAGPTEVRVAAGAMNEAIDTLKLAESQAVALAAEQLDDPILQASVPGTLGRSLHDAVEHLTATLTEREEFRRRLQHEASHDGLTGLLNRTAILEHLASALARTDRSGRALALLFIDLDEFKAINDTHGHHAGDRVLQATARRLLDSVRLGDAVGRLGGDEFVVVAEAPEGLDDAWKLAERVAAECARPIAFEQQWIHLDLSIGVAMTGAPVLDPERLLRRADLAVYRAKETGRRRIQVWDENLGESPAARARLIG